MLLIAVSVFFVLGFVLPIVRLWRRHRVVGLVLDNSDPVEVALRGGLVLAFAGMFAWAYVADRVAAWHAPLAVEAAGWGLIAAGIGLLVAAQAQMGASWRIGIDEKPTELVTGGLYRWVRNPIYSAMGLLLAGVVCVAPDPAPLALALVTLAALVLQARREEQHMLKLHGNSYRDYARRVGRFVPGFGRLA